MERRLGTWGGARQRRILARGWQKNTHFNVQLHRTSGDYTHQERRQEKPPQISHAAKVIELSAKERRSIVMAETAPLSRGCLPCAGSQPPARHGASAPHPIPRQTAQSPLLSASQQQLQPGRRHPQRGQPLATLKTPQKPSAHSSSSN